MAIFSFGPEIPWLAAGGVSEFRAQFALHIQCSFRVSRETQTILDDSDMRRVLAGTAAAELRRAGWNLDEEPTVFDAKAYSLRPVLKAERPTVRFVDLSSDGDLSLLLSGDVLIQILPPKPAEEEAWRFFDRLGSHIVFPL
jgi:hypothetical protein